MSLCTRGISNSGLICTAGLGAETYELPPLPQVGGGLSVPVPAAWRERADEWLLLLVAQLIASHHIH